MSVVTRTNLATNPSVAVDATNWAAVAGTGGTATGARNSGVGYSGTGFFRVSWTAATTAISGGLSYAQSGLTAGAQYVHQMWVRSSKAQTVKMTVQYQNTSTGSVGSALSGAAVALVANTWQRVSVGGVSGATVDSAVLTVAAVTGGSNWANGDTFDGELVCSETPPIIRINPATNPEALSPGTNFGSYLAGVGEAGTTTWVTGAVDGPLPEITSYGRRSITTAKTSGSTGWQATGSTTRTPSAGNTGDVRTVSVYLRYTGTGTLLTTMRALCYSGSTIVGTADATAVALVSGQWTRVSSTVTATAAYDSVGWWAFETSAAIAPAGSTIDATGLLPELATVMYTYLGGNTPAAYGQEIWWLGGAGFGPAVVTPALPGFDGSFPSVNSIVYAWTGTANASASTAATYSPVLSVVAKTDAPCPRVEVTVTDLSPTTNTVTVWRTADGRRQAVRGARKRSMVSADFVIDYESPLNRSLLYELEVVAGVNAQAAVTPATTTVASTYWWIQDPLIPSSAIALDVAKGDRTRPSLARASLKNLEYAAASSIIPILGSPDPVALMGQRLSAGNIMFDMFTSMAQVTTQFRALLQQTPLLLVRSTGLRNDGIPGLAYFNSAKPVECPVTVPFGGTLTEWKLTGDLVAAPTMNVLVPIWTYGNVAALWATYQQAQTAMTGKTYLDALKSPAGT